MDIQMFNIDVYIKHVLLKCVLIVWRRRYYKLGQDKLDSFSYYLQS